MARCPFAAAECDEPLPEIDLGNNHQVWCHEPVPFEEMREQAPHRETWSPQVEQ